MRIVLYGATEVGYMIASRLFREHDIIVLDEGKQIPGKFNGLDIIHVSGGGADIIALEHAQILQADIFIACSLTDEANVVACWTIKKMKSIATVCFVSREEIYQNLTSPVKRNYQTKYDIDSVIWPEQLLTEDIVRIVMVPEAVDVEHFADGKAKLFEYRIKQDSTLCNVRIMDYVFPKNVLIIGITRENVLFIPDGRTRIQYGDKVIFIGTGQALDRLAAEMFQADKKKTSATIIGGGSVGYYLANQMEESGIRVKIIDHDPHRCQFLADKLKKSLVLQGDGTDLELLEEEAVGEMDVVICVTNNDEKNLLCSLLAKQLGVRRIITRTSSERNAELFERVGIDVVVSPQESAMKELLNLMQDRNIDILALVEGGQGKVLLISVPAHFPDTRVMDLPLPSQSIIGVVKRGKQIIIPNGLTAIYAHDQLKIFTIDKNIDSIQDVFQR